MIEGHIATQTIMISTSQETTSLLTVLKSMVPGPAT